MRKKWLCVKSIILTTFYRDEIRMFLPTTRTSVTQCKCANNSDHALINIIFTKWIQHVNIPGVTSHFDISSDGQSSSNFKASRNAKQQFGCRLFNTKSTNVFARSDLVHLFVMSSLVAKSNTRLFNMTLIMFPFGSISEIILS